MQEKTKSSKQVFKNFFMELYVDEVILPDGRESTRTYVHHDGAAAVLPITKDGKIILTKQFRYPIKQDVLEIPAGKKDEPDELGFSCAKRELEEETGYQSDDINHVMDIHNCLGYSDEMIELFIAYDCYKVDQPLEMDEDEFIEVEIYTISQIKEMLSNNEFTDVKTIIMLQHYLKEIGE